MACISNEKIAEARKQLRKIQADEELMECIRLQEIAEWDENTFGPEAMKEAMQEAIKESLEKGKEEGRHQERITVALNLLKLNIPIPQISQATGLSQEEIEKLKNI